MLRISGLVVVDAAVVVVVVAGEELGPKKVDQSGRLSGAGIIFAS